MTFLFLCLQICQIEAAGSSRFEEMIQDPNFMAKTHYFAQRLEELRKLHHFYKNLAKQAPRRNSTLLQSPTSGGVLPDLLMPVDDSAGEDPSSKAESSEKELEIKALPRPVFSNEGALSSLNFDESEYNFNWKSLLPEEIEVSSEYEEGIARRQHDEEGDTESEFSKDFSESAVYDIQSDIMPYLPSNYVSLSSLTPHRPPDLIMSSNLGYTASLRVPIVEEEAKKTPSPVPPESSHEASILNITSLSDDESNVKHAKVKKESKRKKKISGSYDSAGNKKAAAKENSIEADSSMNFAKLTWSRFFGSPKKNIPSKDNSVKKSSKLSSKNKQSFTSFNKTSDKIERKIKDKEKSTSGKEDQQRNSRENRSSHREIENSKQTKSLLRTESDIRSKTKSSSGRKASGDYKTSGSNASSNGRGSKRDSASKDNNYQMTSGKQDLSGRSRNTFQRESLCFQASNASASSSHPGYDSGADSGVGLKVRQVLVQLSSSSVIKMYIFVYRFILPDDLCSCSPRQLFHRVEDRY